MRKIILCCYCTLAGNIMFGQGSAGIGSATPNSSVQLDVTSIDKGLLIPGISLASASPATLPATRLFAWNEELNQRLKQLEKK